MELEFKKNSGLLNIAARAAHDIRSPIAVIEIGLQLIEEHHSKKDLTIVRMAVQRIRDIANNLLDQYRNQSALQLLPVKALLEEIALLKRYEWLEKNCILTLSFNSITEADQIIGNPTEIKRMLSNILNNAIEACDQDANIIMHASRIDNFIQIEISDNGIGIPAEKIEDYLNGNSEKHNGPGIGLLNAKKYMESLNGELMLTSQPGKRTSVKLKFKIDSLN